MESAVYVQGALKRQLKSPWLRSSPLVALATGGRENRTCQMENVSYSRSREQDAVGRGEERELGLSLPHTLAVPLPLERMPCEGEGLFPERKAFRRRGKVERGNTPENNTTCLLHCFRGD